MKRLNISFIITLVLVLFGSVFADDIETTFGGAGWLQMGRIQKSWIDPSNPNINNNYNKNWMQDAGAVLNVNAKISENWAGALELGTIQVHLARGAFSQAKKWYPFWVPFVSYANIAYTQNNFNLTIGSFRYSYGPDNKNLGLYLMHGYVYPGAIVSSFLGPLDPLKTLFGAKATYSIAGLRNDLILNIETADKPLYDISIADYLNYKIIEGIEVGAGVNFYRLIPQNSDATSPSKTCVLGQYGETCGLEDSTYVFNPITDAIDSLVLDTITGSLAGTKLIARFSFDPKPLLGGIDALGATDLIFYGEGAILGLKDYSVAYTSISERMPFMLGFNFPTFGLFNLSGEIEYYTSPNSSDNLAAQNGSWVPKIEDAFNQSRDDFKWSVNASRVFFGHMILIGQVANDNIRLGGSHDDTSGKVATTIPTDWYWTTKIAYFF